MAGPVAAAAEAGSRNGEEGPERVGCGKPYHKSRRRLRNKQSKKLYSHGGSEAGDRDVEGKMKSVVYKSNASSRTEKGEAREASGKSGILQIGEGGKAVFRRTKQLGKLLILKRRFCSPLLCKDGDW